MNDKISKALVLGREIIASNRVFRQRMLDSHDIFVENRAKFENEELAKSGLLEQRDSYYLFLVTEFSPDEKVDQSWVKPFSGSIFDPENEAMVYEKYSEAMFAIKSVREMMLSHNIAFNVTKMPNMDKFVSIFRENIFAESLHDSKIS